MRVVRYYPHWVTPFGDPRIKACSAAPRGLSQPATSFIASQCQGIHPTPLVVKCRTATYHHAVIKEQNFALWWAHLDLNQEPLPYQDSALTR